MAVEIDHGATFSLRVADDGVGLAPEVVDSGHKEGHFGLSGMHERARKLGGWLGVRVPPEGGTELMLTVPGQIAYKTLERRMSLW